MQLIPQTNKGWLVLIICFFSVYYFFLDDRPQRNRSSSNTNSLDLVPSDERASLLEKPTEYIMEKMNQNPTGKAILQSWVQEAVNKELGQKDISVTVAEEKGILQIQDVKRGTGAMAMCGSNVTFHYEILNAFGVKIFSTRDINEPLTVTLGAGQIIKGMEHGMIGMQEQGIRKLAVPPRMAYKDTGFTNSLVPENKAHIFKVSVSDVASDSNLIDNIDVELVQQGKGAKPVMCGDSVTFRYQKRPSTDEAVVIEGALGSTSIPAAFNYIMAGNTKGTILDVTLPFGALNSGEIADGFETYRVEIIDPSTP